MGSPRVVAVVLNWNRRDDTRECLESLAASDEPVGVVLVDNGSTECPAGELVAGARSERFAGLELVANAENLGFARGMNAGIRRALERDPRHVWILNNDVVVDPLAARRLADALDERADVAAAGPLVYDRGHPGVLSNAGGRVSLARGRTWHVHEGRATPPCASPYPVDYVEGSAPMLRALDLREQGGFDEAYGAYWEDVDWCLAARRRGRGVIVVPSARAFHRVSASSGVHSEYAMYHRARNRFRCVRKHGSGADRVTARLAALADLPLDLYHARRASGDARASRAWLRGTWDGFLARGS